MPRSRKAAAPSTPSRAATPRIPPSTVVSTRPGAARQPRGPAVEAAKPAVAGAAALEREADFVAERWAQVPLDRPDLAPPSVPSPAAGSGAAAAPEPVRAAIRGRGQALAPRVRGGLEAGFGQSLGAVRIHDHADADAAAAALGALAFAYGNDIGFRAGGYAPDTGPGRALLAHELTHVIQQGGSPRLQLKEDPETAAPVGPALPIRVYITGPLSKWQLLIEIIKQHLGAADDLEALRIAADEFSGFVKWGLTTFGEIGEEAIARGYVWVRLDHPLILKQQAHRKEYFQDFPEPGQDAFDLLAANEAQGDARKTDSLLDRATRDELVQQRLLATRDELVRQHQKFQALPKLLQDFLQYDPAPPIASSVDIQAALGVAAKIGTLSVAELEEFEDGHPVAAADWATFESSIDLFLAERDQRIMEEAARRQSVESGLTALGAELIDRYYAYKDMPAVLPWGGLVVPNDAKGLEGSALNEALVAAGLAGGLETLEWMIGEYEEAFARDAARLIRIQLDRQLHELMVQEKRYLSTDDAEQLGEAVGKTGAAADYDEASAAELLSYVAPHSPVDFGARAAQAEGSGREKVLTLAAAGDHPLIMQPDFDLDGLAHAGKGEALSLILKDIAERREAVGHFKDKLEKSEFIFRNGEIFERSLVAQGIAPGSMFDRILRERREREEVEEMLEGLVLVVAGIAAAAMTGGLGWVAVVGELATAVLDANALYSTLSDYQEGSDAYKIGWSSTEPSAVDLAISIGADMIPWDKLVDGLLRSKMFKGSRDVEFQTPPRAVEMIGGAGQFDGGESVHTLEISRSGEFINNSGKPGKQSGGGSGTSKGSKRGTGSKKPSNQKQFYNQKPLKKSERTSSADINEMLKKKRPKAKKTAVPEMKTAAKTVGPEISTKQAGAMVPTAEETSVVKKALIKIWSEAFAKSIAALDLTGQHDREEQALAAVREAGEIIAKAMRLGLSVDEALAFVDLRRSGVSAAEVEKIMTIMAMMDAESWEIAPLDFGAAESGRQSVPPKK